jgi:Flp pilus assembly secretin CpaC
MRKLLTAFLLVTMMVTNACANTAVSLMMPPVTAIDGKVQTVDKVKQINVKFKIIEISKDIINKLVEKK